MSREQFLALVDKLISRVDDFDSVDENGQSVLDKIDSMVSVLDGQVIDQWDSEQANKTYQEYLTTNLDKYDGKLITASRAYFNEHLSGKEVRTKIGLVRINSKSRGKIHDRMRDTKYLAIPYIPEVLMTGDVSDLIALNKDRTDSVVGYYEFKKSKALKDYILNITLKVALDSEGNLLYYLGASKEKANLRAVSHAQGTTDSKAGFDSQNLSSDPSISSELHGSTKTGFENNKSQFTPNSHAHGTIGLETDFDSIESYDDDEINIDVQVLDKDGNVLSDEEAEKLLFGDVEDFDGVTDIDIKAHEAATSPLNNLELPSIEQKESGDYQKGHLAIGDLNIAIENPAGSIRSGTDAQGNEWQITMKHHYGFIENTMGADGDEIDVFVKNHLDHIPDHAYIIKQLDKDGKFDEHKVILGAETEDEAKEIYLSNYEQGWQGFGDIKRISMADLLQKIQHTWSDYDSVGNEVVVTGENVLTVIDSLIAVLQEAV